jgi:hypothetical protein
MDADLFPPHPSYFGGISMNSPDDLSAELRTWKVNPPHDPDFRRAVWRRIEEQRRVPTWGVFVKTRALALGTALVLTIGISGWAGHTVARARVQVDREVLAASYVASLDARVHTGLAR